MDDYAVYLASPIPDRVFDWQSPDTLSHELPRGIPIARGSGPLYAVANAITVGRFPGRSLGWGGAWIAVVTKGQALRFLSEQGRPITPAVEHLPEDGVYYLIAVEE